MSSNSSIRELPPGDPELTASIVSHLKSRGLFDKLRRDCLGDVDTKPAYLNLKQRIEGYITKFLSTQTWTPDMNKNHVRDTMRREINESGMLSAGMDHLVDQIVNPKIYQVFTPEVENGVRQYLGLSSEDSSTQQPAPETAADMTSQPPPQMPALPPPPPPKSEFSIDETTQDVPGSCSPKPYIEAFMPDDFTDSSSEPHLMIVTDNSERTEELPAELSFEEAASVDMCDTSAEPIEPVVNETSGEALAPEQIDDMELELQVACPSGNADERLPAEDGESSIPLDNMKSDLLTEVKPIEVDKKDGEKIIDVTKKEVKPVDKDRKERKLDSGKGRESNSHSSRMESHSKTHISKKGLDVSRSKPHRSRGDGDLIKESRDVSKEKDKHGVSRDKASSSKVETSKSRTDVSKDERSKGYSSQPSRSKESDSRSERKRSDDRHRHYSSSQSHDDKKRHNDKHPREEKSRDRSDSHRSHSENRKDKGKSSTKVSSRQHKPSKSSEKHGESSRKDRGHEKERKQDYSRQNSSDGRDDGPSKKPSSEDATQPTCHNSFQTHDSTLCHVDVPETFRQNPLEMHTNSHDSSQLSFQSASQDSSLGMVEYVAQKGSKEDISNAANQGETVVDVQAAEEMSGETLSEAYDECSQGALQLVEAKEAEILRFSYVTDKVSGNSGIDLQLVDTVTEEQPQAVHDEEPVVQDNAQLEKGNQKSSPSHAALLDVPEQESPLEEEKHEAVRLKATTEKNSPEKKRPRREPSDGHESDAAWSDVTVSSVHTSDLSSYDDRISVSSADEGDCAAARQRKKIPLSEIKKIASSSNEDDDRMSRSETEPSPCDVVVPLPVLPEEVTECEPTPTKDLQPPCPEPLQCSNTEQTSKLSGSPPSTVITDSAPEPKMGLRRTRKINPKYVSEEFSSIFTEGKRPAGTIDFSELAKYGKERHHDEQPSLRAESRKVPAREDVSDDLGTPMLCDETDRFSDTSITDRSRRPARRPSGSESRSRSESTSSKRYQSSDLYKPRPVIPSRSRRSRPSPTREDAPKRQRGLKVCIGAKRGRPSTGKKL